ncbi:hypothetical protein QR685DRAFT_261868 [Neurospora intermedia]|uniref:Uncharacterized protein n=1 Tax=Neurospora intermedia TaxID=5142 RepID=A0ABR3DDF4_NEUIN
MPRHISTSGPTHGTGGPLCGDTVIKCDGSMGEDEQSPAHRVTHDWGVPTNTAIPRELNNQGLPIIPPDHPEPSRNPTKRPAKGHKHEKPSHLGKSQLDWTCPGMVQIIDRWMHRSHFPFLAHVLSPVQRHNVCSHVLQHAAPCRWLLQTKKRTGRSSRVGLSL